MTRLTRQLGLTDAVVLGMGAMLGAGVFVGLLRPLARLDGPPDRARPVLAQLLVGLATVVGMLVLDLRQAIAVSSVALLVYYAIGHAAAFTLPGTARRTVPVLGLLGCLTIAGALLVPTGG